jgi:hypothetical protein
MFIQCDLTSFVFLKYSSDLAVKNHSKLNKKAFFVREKEFFVHKEEKIEKQLRRERE